jgi:coenzyme Q-binding protein COQ10
MPFYKKEKTLPFSCEELYGLVLDVGQYPQFLPGVLKAHVYNVGVAAFDADLTVGSPLFSITYTSCVTPTHPISIESICTKGPLNLKSLWTFAKIPNSSTTEVCFQVDFSFHNPILQKMIEKTFSSLVENMMNAFEKRAYALYKFT